MEVEGENTIINQQPQAFAQPQPAEEQQKPQYLQGDANLPWIEKYRPQRLEDVISHKDVIFQAMGFVNGQDFPNMIFHGPAGTGKTTTAMIIANQVYGSAGKYMTKVLNASDDRGISVVREQIEVFCQQKGIQVDGCEDVSHLPKLVILDEADSMTQNAQYALRKTMEVYHSKVRFILVCNFAEQIVPEIHSRCKSLRLAGLTFEDVGEIARRVSFKEGFDITREAEIALAKSSDGDLRKVLNVMQSASRLIQSCTDSTSSSDGQTSIADGNKADIDEAQQQQEQQKRKVITEESIVKVSGAPMPDHIDRIMDILLTENFYDALKNVKEVMSEYQYDLVHLIDAIYDEVLMLELPFNARARLVTVLSDVDHRLAKLGTRQDQQLAAVVGAFIGARAVCEKLHTYNTRKNQSEDQLQEQHDANVDLNMMQEEMEQQFMKSASKAGSPSPGGVVPQSDQKQTDNLGQQLQQQQQIQQQQPQVSQLQQQGLVFNTQQDQQAAQQQFQQQQMQNQNQNQQLQQQNQPEVKQELLTQQTQQSQMYTSQGVNSLGMGQTQNQDSNQEEGDILDCM